MEPNGSPRIKTTFCRARFLDYLEQAYPKLIFPGRCAQFLDKSAFKRLLVGAAKKNWMVYAKAPFLGPKQVIDYLGNYTHKIAISNHRIQNIEDGHITFRYRDRADDSKVKQMRLPAKEFMRRFLLHVLPTKFVRIRHFGLLGSRDKQKKLNHARRLLNVRQIEKTQDPNWQELLMQVTGHDVRKCPKCKTGHLIEVETILPHLTLRRRGYRSDTS